MPEDFIRETPQDIPVAGRLAAGIRKVGEFASKPFGYDNPPGEMAYEYSGAPALARILDSVAYKDSKILKDSPEGRAARMDVMEALPLGSALASKGSKIALKAADKLVPEAGELRMFMGPSAKTADLQTWKKAESLETEGASPDHIWQETGWFKGKDGKWRWEISDKDATADIAGAIRENRAEGAKRLRLIRDAMDFKWVQDHNPGLTKEAFFGKDAKISPLFDQYVKNHSHEELKQLAEKHFNDLYAPINLKLTDVLKNHPELFDAYPELKDMMVRAGHASPGSSGSFRAPYPNEKGMGAISTKPEYNYQYNEDTDQINTILHEIQHAIQQKEGFDPGANLEHILKQKNLNTTMTADNLRHSQNVLEFKKFLDQHPGIDPNIAWDMMGQQNRWHGGQPGDNYKSHFIKDIPRLDTEHIKQFADYVKKEHEDTLKKYGITTRAEAKEGYMQSHGELESRATEARRDMTKAERRHMFPLRSYDRPYDKIKFESELYDPETRLTP